MFDDPWPEEPDDPYPDYGDPEERFDIDIPSPEDVDVSSDLYRAFWGLVAVFNVGLFATALGVLMIVSGMARQVGGVITAIGVASLAYGLHRYRVYRADWPW